MSVDILLSFAFHRTTDLGAVRAALGPDQRLMIDSGGFTAFSKGKEIRLSDYIAFLRHWEGAWDYAMSLDVIGNPQATAANLHSLERAGIAVLPIYTATAHPRELSALAKTHPYVAYGGLVGVPRSLQIPATQRVVALAQEHGCKVHALGQTGIEMFDATGVHSGDSSAVSNAARYFQLPIFVPQRRRMEPLMFGQPSLWTTQAVLLKAYGLSAPECISGDAVRSKEGRAAVYYAGCLSVATMAAALRNGANEPRVYSALTASEVVDGACRAAIDWRANNVHHSLLRLKSGRTTKGKP